MQALGKISDQKVALCVLGILTLACIITGRLAYLQLHIGKDLHAQSQKNFLRFETIQAPRGNIFDAEGTLLATNRPVYNIVWCGSGQQKLDAQQLYMLEALELIIEQPIKDHKELLHEITKAERHQKRTPLAYDVNFEQLCKIEESFPENKNLCIETEFQRFYPHGTCASHVLGYLGNINTDPSGRMGIEKIFEEQLRGKCGVKQKTINSLGRNLAVQTLHEALSGNDIQTTINLNVQKIAEHILPQECRGTCIIFNPENGAIEALVSRPDFDPNVFLGPILPHDWHAMQEEQLFLNRAFNACYPPGSIFKLVTASAALQEELITQETCWTCKGYMMFANRKYLCQCGKTFGPGDKLTAKQTLARSCNTFFYDIGKKIPIDTLASYAHQFGLGQKTTSSFPEKTGLIPTSRWKLQTKGERWWPGESLSASIGQSFLLVTPIQIARMIGSIFTGYLVNPRIVTSEPLVKTPLTIEASTLQFLQDSMRAVITQGTGQRMSRIKDLEIYAKTSTAQTSGLEKRSLGTAYYEHGWFVAYFKYKNSNPLVLILLVEHAGTSRVTAHIAKKFLLEYKSYWDNLAVGP